MDLLGDILRTSGVRGANGPLTEAGGTWGVRPDRFPGAALHAPVEGCARLSTGGRAPQHLMPGDVVRLGGSLEGVVRIPGRRHRA